MAAIPELKGYKKRTVGEVTGGVASQRSDIHLGSGAILLNDKQVQTINKLITTGFFGASFADFIRRAVDDKIKEAVADDWI